MINVFTKLSLIRFEYIYIRNESGDTGGRRTEDERRTDAQRADDDDGTDRRIEDDDNYDGTDTMVRINDAYP